MKQILRNTWIILAVKERKEFMGLIFLDMIISAVDILALAALVWIIQLYVQPGDHPVPPFLPVWLRDRSHIGLTGIFFVLFGAKNMAAYLANRAYYRFAGQVAVRLSALNLRKFQQSGFDEFIQTDSSVHIRRIALQPFEFCQYILGGIQQITTQLFLIVLAVTAILFFNARLFLLLLVILVPPVALLFHLIKNRLDKTRKNIRSGNEKSYQYLLDALKGYVEGNLYDRNDFFRDRFIAARKKFSTALFESISIQQMPPRIIETFAVSGLFILVLVARWSGNVQNDSLVTIGAFMAAAYKIIPGMVKLINTTGQMRAYGFAAGELSGQPGARSVPGAEQDGMKIESFHMDGIDFRYGNEPILDNFSLEACRGDFIGISGESGKGKTTILNLLLGFLEPAKGTFRINHSPAPAGDLARFWPRIAYVRQQPFLIHDTIEKNITLSDNGVNQPRLEMAIRAAGLDQLVAASKDGIHKLITENGKNISGGQQQRICIARALYKEADLVLLDEPFNELDEASVLRLLGHFRQLAREGRIILMITHDSKSLGWCNKTVRLE